MDESLFDYALNQLPTDKRAEVERLIASDPTAAERLRILKAAISPLAVDHELEQAPPGLALAAIAYTAEYLVTNGLYSARDGFTPPSASTEPDSRYRESRWQPALRGWVNAAVVAAIVLLALGLGLPAVQKARQSYQQYACQDNLRQLHAGLVGYSETHDGQFPQAGTANVPTAGGFYAELARSGQPIAESARSCPIRPADPLVSPVGYSYSLGFRDQLGRLTGLRRPETAEDLTPIVADLPTGGHAGWNVLYVGGSVQYSRSHLTADGDDLFRNAAGRTAAGLHRGDVCLGRPFDVP